MSTQSDAVSVCHVVNAVDTTSVPADIATALSKYTAVEADILAWFSAVESDVDDAVTVHCVDAPGTTLGVNGRVLRETRDVVADYDVIQTHHNHSGTFAKLLAAAGGKVIVSTEQNTHGGFTKKGLVGNAVTNALADEVTCVSESVCDSFSWWERLLLGDTDTRVIYNGIDIERAERSVDGGWSVSDAADVDPNAFLVGTAGLMTEQKAHDVLIEAVGRARDRGFDVDLVIAGDGDLEPYLRGIVDERNLDSAVHFLGLLDRSEVYSLLAELDLYAMPSRWEGFSAAAVEALGLGVPCLFSNIDEFTKPYANVAAFHRVDDVEDLSERLCELVEDDEWRTKLGEMGRERAKAFSLESIAHDYADLYEELLAEDAVSPPESRAL